MNTEPWPWYISGPLIGLFVPALLMWGNRQFGISNNLRHICAAIMPGDLHFFRYDWKSDGLWNLTFLVGVFLGGVIAAQWLGAGDIALAPSAIFSWTGLMTFRGAVMIIGGGFLVGFGTAYAGGCTSGHAISGLAALQPASLIAVIGFFAGGLLCTYFILPYIL